jgi:methyl-accepting chemotaxis protein
MVKMGFKLSSIRARLLFLILPLIILSVGSLTGLSYYFSNLFLSKSINGAAAAISSDYSNQISAEIHDRVLEIEGLINNPVIVHGDKEQIVKFLAESHKRLGTFDNINVYNLDGRGMRIDGSQTFIGDRDYFKTALSTKKMCITEPAIARGTGKFSILIVIPIMENGEIVKLIMGSTTLDRITELTKKVKFQDTGYATLLDKSGLIIAHAKMPDLNGKVNVIKNTFEPDIKGKVSDIDKNYANLVEAEFHSAHQLWSRQLAF